MDCAGSKDSGTVKMVSLQGDSSSDSMPSQLANDPIPCETNKDLNPHQLVTADLSADAIGCSDYKDSRNDSKETLTELSRDLLPSQLKTDPFLIESKIAPSACHLSTDLLPNVLGHPDSSHLNGYTLHIPLSIHQSNPCSNTITIFECNHINDLNYDCLKYLFEYLPSLKDRSEMDLVCRKWNDLNKEFWSSLSSLKIDEQFKIKYFRTDAEENTAFVLNVLHKISTLDNIFLEDLSETDLKWDKFLKFSERMLKNITELGLYRLNLSEERFELFLKSKKSIKKMSFEDLKINPSNLEVLNRIFIEVLIITNCAIDQEELFIDFLSTLPNLKILELRYSVNQLNKVVDSLNLNHFDNIEGIVLLIRRQFSSLDLQIFHNSLGIFLSSQKNLRKLNLWEVPLSLLNCMPSLQKLEELELHNLSDELLNILPRIKNLKLLTGCIPELKNQNLINLTKCEQLKELTINMAFFSIIGDGMNHLGEFLNLETLNMSIGCYNGRYTPKLHDCLSAISSNKTIKHLRLKGIRSLKHNLNKFENLKTFHISSSEINNKLLADVVEKSTHLKHCFIEDCEGVDEYFIKLIENSKKPDKLKITFKTGNNEKIFFL